MNALIAVGVFQCQARGHARANVGACRDIPWIAQVFAHQGVEQVLGKYLMGTRWPVREAKAGKGGDYEIEGVVRETAKCGRVGEPWRQLRILHEAGWPAIHQKQRLWTWTMSL